MVKLLRPKNHSLMDECLGKLRNDTDREQFRIFIHYLILKNHYSRSISDFVSSLTDELFKKNLEVGIHSNFLHSKIFHKGNYLNIIEIAGSSGAVIVNKSYRVGGYTKSYRVNYLGKEIEVENYNFKFEKNLNKESFEKLFQYENIKRDNVTEQEIQSAQTQFISKLEFNKELFYEKLNEIIKKKKKIKPLSIYDLNYFSILESECLSFHQLKNYSFQDDFSGRYYNFFTNKKSAIRKCFFINGRSLSSLDIKSSQIYFLTQLPNIDLSKYEVDKTLIKIDSSFTNEVLKGDIYLFFGAKLKLTRGDILKLTGYDILELTSDVIIKLIRDIAKEKLLSYIYGDKRLKRVADILEEYFPETFKTLQYLQNIPIENEKFRYTITHKESGKLVPKNTYLNYILQSVERDIFLSSLEEMSDYYTVHDSVYFQKGREDEFRTKILNHFGVNNLDKPRLELED